MEFIGQLFIAILCLVGVAVAFYFIFGFFSKITNTTITNKRGMPLYRPNDIDDDMKKVKELTSKVVTNAKTALNNLRTPTENKLNVLEKLEALEKLDQLRKSNTINDQQYEELKSKIVD